MVKKVAKKVHKVSIRAEDVARKQIYKPVLTTPFEIKWPVAPPHARAQILEALIDLLAWPSVPSPPPASTPDLPRQSTSSTASAHKDAPAVPSEDGDFNIADYRASLWARKRKRKPKTMEELRKRKEELGRRREEKRQRRARDGAEVDADGGEGGGGEGPMLVNSERGEAANHSTLGRGGEPLSGGERDTGPANPSAEADLVDPKPQPADSNPKPVQGPSHTVSLRSGATLTVPDLPASSSSSLPKRQPRPAPRRPEVLDHLVVGINAVTKAMEDHTRFARARLSTSAEGAGQGSEGKEVAGPFRLVFVCRSDINPPSLVAHVPPTVAASNESALALRAHSASSSSFPVSPAKEVMDVDPPSGPVANGGEGAAGKKEKSEWDGRALLVQLGEGAEQALADALGLRRVAAIGIDHRLKGIEPLAGLVAHYVTPPSAPWLAPRAPTRAISSLSPKKQTAAPAATDNISNAEKAETVRETRLVPTHIKHYKTSAPLDPKGVRKAKVDELKRKRDARGVRVRAEKEKGREKPRASNERVKTGKKEEGATKARGGGEDGGFGKRAAEQTDGAVEGAKGEEKAGEKKDGGREVADESTTIDVDPAIDGGAGSASDASKKKKKDLGGDAKPRMRKRKARGRFF